MSEIESADLPPIAEMSFEAALSELESIVQKLERGKLELEPSILAYERGTQLRQHCDAKLKEAQLRVEKLTLAANGEVTLSPMDGE